jgi:hypothetical protein
MNLALNAIDAMPRGGTLRVAVDRIDSAPPHASSPPGGGFALPVRLTVSDTGVGIDRETRNRVFEPFFTTKPRGKGTGLGLPMVRRIVENHGGSVQLDSERGRGTVCRVYLPDGSSGGTGKPEPTSLVVADRSE